MFIKFYKIFIQKFQFLHKKFDTKFFHYQISYQYYFVFSHLMQKSIHEFQNLLKQPTNYFYNEHLKDALDKFDFIFYPDILPKEKKVKQYENNSKIVIIDEYMENDIKYYILCFDYKLIILPQGENADKLILPSIITRFEESDKYFIQNCDIQFETDTANENFFNEIRNFSKKFRISNEKVQHFWSIIVNCLSGFLIKKGYQNSRNKHDQYLNDKFDEYKEKHRTVDTKPFIIFSKF